jgi:uroporphyrinogen decarboxylase
MNPKNRVMKTISHTEPDRVPIGEFGIDHDHVERILGVKHSYWRNRKDATLALWDNRRDEMVEGLKHDCEALMLKLDMDVITVHTVPSKNHRCEDPPRRIGDGVWEDKRGHIYKYAASNDSIQCMGHGEGLIELSDAVINSIEKECAADLDDSTFELVDYIGQKYGNERAILYRDLPITGFLNGPFGGDYGHSISISMLCPDQMKRLYGACETLNRKIAERCRQSNVSLAIEGYDFGMNTGCIISPACIRDVYFPIMKKVNDIHREHGMTTFFHCCGKIWDIMDDYVSAGYEGYQSIQESAGMDTRRVKKLYGNKLTLWTGVQCETLVEATIEETRREVASALDYLMPGGGFIFGSTNSVQYGAKTDNYLAALETVREKGVYKTGI